MSKIKSFKDWIDQTNLEYDKRIRELFDEALNLELETMAKIKEIALEYQDDGCLFKFGLSTNLNGDHHGIYTSFNSSRWDFVFDSHVTKQAKDEALEILDRLSKKECKVSLSISMSKCSPEQASSFQDQVRATFKNDWVINIHKPVEYHTGIYYNMFLSETPLWKK